MCPWSCPPTPSTRCQGGDALVCPRSAFLSPKTTGRGGEDFSSRSPQHPHSPRTTLPRGCGVGGHRTHHPICFAPKNSAPSNTPSALPRLSDGKRGPPKRPEKGWADGGSWRGDNPEGMPKGTGGSDTMLPLRGPRRGSRPFLPRHNRGGPTRHLGALCGGRPPPSAPPFCPPSDNGSALCAWLDKDFVAEKEPVFVCQKRSAKKRDGEERVARAGQRPSPQHWPCTAPATPAIFPTVLGGGWKKSPCWELGEVQPGDRGAAGSVTQTPSPVPASILVSIPASIPPNASSPPRAQHRSVVAEGPCPPAWPRPPPSPSRCPPATVPGDGISKTYRRLILRPPRSCSTGVREGGRDNPRLQHSQSRKEQD